MSEPRRRLLVVPIVHSEVELGSELEGRRQAFIAHHGAAAWARQAAVIESYWRGVSELILGLPLPFDRVKVYQDSLPTAGEPGALLAELAERGSPNHRLVRTLAERGAAIVGTESAELLLEEYQLVKSGVADEAAIRRSIEARDRFIARRIGETLAAGEIGILFIGAGHNVPRFLAAEIGVAMLSTSARKAGA